MDWWRSGKRKGTEKTEVSNQSSKLRGILGSQLQDMIRIGVKRDFHMNPGTVKY
jgi:hypothetical protein